MAITSSYPIAPPTITDTLVGTKFIENKEPTTNSFNIGDIIQLASSTIGYTPVSIGTANGLSLSGQVLSLGLSSSSTNGALSSANWTTFNNKQNALSGTGFIKASGSTISYDNTAYTPEVRTLTINGTTYDLSANRSWTVGDTGSLEFNSTDLTVWNNGKGNITSTSFGEGVLKSNTTGLHNTGFGYRVLFNNTTGEFNTAIGFQDLANNSGGANNVAVGGALNQNTIGSDNVGMGLSTLNANISGSSNTALGRGALLSILSGNNNIALGYQAGRYSGATSSSNIYIGPSSGPTSPTNENNKLYISNSQGTPLIGGDFSAKTVTIDGAITATKFIIQSSTPASSTATGTAGEITYDATYAYICIATNTWRRIPLLTW